jgi:uncharacterized protein
MEIKDRLAGHLSAGRIPIIARPNSRKTLISGYDEAREALKVDVAAPPEDNKANIELIRFFSKLSGRKARIAVGMKSKHKIIALS